MTNTDTSRAEFEAWNPVRGNVRHNPGEYYADYVDSIRQAQWEGWQARAQPTAEHSSAVEPQIDGYPLWSGLPPPVMSEKLVRYDAVSVQNNGYEWGVEMVIADAGRFVEFDDVRAILAAQADHIEDKLNMVTQPITQPLIAKAARDDVDVDDEYQPPTELECDEFRRVPGSFNDMVRAIHSAGYHRYAGAANKAFGAHYSTKYDAAIASIKRDDVAGDAKYAQLAEAAKKARLQSKLWMRDHGQDIASQEAIKAIDAAIVASNKDAP